MKLIDPFETASGSKTETAKTSRQESARWEPSPTGLCPVCNSRMKEVQANGIPSYACLEHRVALPIEDRVARQ